MKRLILIATMAALAVLIALPVRAITNGQPDGDDHPYVGLVVFYADEAGTIPMWRCSGSLLSPTVFLTAGHCTEPPAAHAQVWFAEDVQSDPHYPFPGPNSVGGTPHTHPDYNPAAFYLFDLGVVVLDTPVVMDEYAELPEQGVLDDLAKARGKQDTSITAVGYGLQRINPVFIEAQRIRLQAVLDLVDVKGTAGIPAGTSVMLSGNAHTGGTCFGDSGGPLLLNDTNVVVAVTSFGLNGNCAGVGGGYRVDMPDDLEWLATFLEDDEE